MRFVDTNVLLYAVSALSQEEAGKSAAVLSHLLRQGNLSLLCPCRYCKSSTHQATRSTSPVRLAITHEQALEFIESGPAVSPFSR